MAELDQQLRQLLATRVSARDMLLRIGHHPESIRELGTMLKCFCPIHGETKVATLLIDLKKGAYKCTKTSCAASAGGPTGELYLLHQKLSGTAGLLRACRDLGIALPPDVEDRVEADLAFRVEAAISSGQFEEALALGEESNLSGKAHPSVLLALGRAEEAQGREAKAVDFFLRASRAAQMRREAETAIRILAEEAIRLQPANVSLKLRLADAIEEQGRLQEADALRLEVLDLRERSGNSAENCVLIERLLPRHPGTEMILRLARSLEAAELFDRALEQFALAADRAMVAGDSPLEREALESIALLAPLQFPRRMRLLELMAETDAPEIVAEEAAALGFVAAESDSPKLARQALEQSLSLVPGQFEVLDTLIRLAREGGDGHALSRFLREIAKHYQQQELDNEVERSLSESIEADPNNVDALIAWGRFLLTEGRRDDAAPVWDRVVELLRRQGDDTQDAESFAARFLEGAPNDPASAEVAAMICHALGREQSAQEVISRFIERTVETDPAAAIRAGRFGLQLFNHRRQQQKQLFPLFMAREEIFDAASLAADMIEDRDDETPLDEECLRMAEQALAALPRHERLLRQLARFREESGDTAEALELWRRLRDTPEFVNSTRLEEVCSRILSIEPEDVATQLLLARGRAKAGRFADAENAFLRAVNLLEQHGSSDALIGVLEEAVQLPETTLETIRRAADMQFKSGDVYRAHDLYDLLVTQALEEGDDVTIAESFAHAIERDDRRGELRSRHAAWLSEQGQMEEAREERLRAEELYRASAEPSRAREQLELLIGLNPQDAEALSRRGELSFSQGDAEAGTADLLAAAQVFAESEDLPRASDLLESLRDRAAHPDAVLAVLAGYQERMDAAEKAAKSLLEQALHLRESRRLDEAEGVLLRASQLDPRSVNIAVAQAELLTTAKKMEAASAAWQRAARISSDADDAATALEHLRHALKCHPGNRAARVEFGEQLLATGDRAGFRSKMLEIADNCEQEKDPESAAEILSRLGEEFPGEEEIVRRGARLLAETGREMDAATLLRDAADRELTEDPVLARSYLDQAISHWPNDRVARSLVASLCAREGDLEAAADQHLALLKSAAKSGENELLHRLLDQAVTDLHAEPALQRKLAALLRDLGHGPLAAQRMLGLAQKHLHDDEAAESEAFAREGLAAAEDDIALLTVLAEALGEQGRREEAAGAWLAVADHLDAGEPLVRALQHAAAMRPKDAAIAERHLDASLSMASADVREAFSAWRRLGDERDTSKEAIGRFRGYIAQYPQDLDAREALATRLLLTDERAAAFEQYAEIAAIRRAKDDAAGALVALRQWFALDEKNAWLALDITELALGTQHPTSSEDTAIAARLALTMPPTTVRAMLETLSHLAPGDATVRAALAEQLWSQGEQQQARDEFRAVLLLDLDETRHRAILAQWKSLDSASPTPLEMEGLHLARSGETEAAVRAWREAARLHDESGDLEGLTRCLRAAHDLEPQNLSLTRALADAEERRGALSIAADLWRIVAEVAARSHLHDDQRRAWEKITQLDPEDPEGWQSLASFLATEDRRAESARAYVTAATQFRAGDRLPFAIECCRRAVACDPCLLDAYRLRFEMVCSSGNHEHLAEAAEAASAALLRAGLEDEAFRVLEDAAAAAPEEASLTASLAARHLESGRSDDAFSLLHGKARQLFEGGEYARSLGLTRRGMELFPARTEFRKLMAENLEGAGDGPLAADVFLETAEALFRSGDSGAAADLAAKAAGNAPEDPERILRAVLLLFENDHAAVARVMLAQASERIAARAGSADVFLRSAMTALPDSDVVLTALCEAAWRSESLGLFAELTSRRAAALDAAGSPANAAAVLAEAISRCGNAVPISLLEARVLYLLKTPETSDQQRADALDALLVAARDAGDSEKALDAAEQLIELRPNDEHALGILVSAALESGRWMDALDRVLALGKVREKQERWQDAVKLYEQLLELDTDNPDGLRGMMNCHRALGDLDLLEQRARILVEIYRQAGALEEAATVLREISDCIPENLSIIEELAGAYERAEMHREMVATLKRVARLQEEAGLDSKAISTLEKVELYWPDDLETLEQLGDLHFRGGNKEAAMVYLAAAAEKQEMLGNLGPAARLCDRIVALDPNNAAIRTMRSVLFEAMGRQEDAATELSELTRIHLSAGRDTQAADALAHLLLLSPLRSEKREEFATLLLKLKRTREAFEQYDLLALESERSGDFDRALEFAEAARSLQPESPELHTRLAHIYGKLGRVDGAVEAQLWLAKYHRREKDLDAALAHVDQALAIEPGHINARIEQALLQRELGRTEDAIAGFLKIGRQAILEGDLRTAVRSLTLARDIQPDDLETRRKLVDLYDRLADRDQSLAELLQVMRIHLEQGMVEEARSLVSAAYAEHGDNPDIRRSVAGMYQRCGIPELAATELVELARLHRGRGEPDLAQEAAQEAIIIRPGDIAARRLLIEAMQDLGRHDAAYEALIDMGREMVDRGRYDASLDVLRDARKVRPDEPAPRRLLVRSLTELGRTDELVAELRELADLCLKMDARDEAVETLKRLLAIRPDDTRARINYIDAYRTVGQEIDLVDDYLKLAELHTKRGAVREARKLFDRLAQLAPQRLDIRDRHVQLLLAFGDDETAVAETYSLVGDYLESARFREAQQALQRIREKVTGDPDFHINLARVHNASNARGMAMRELHTAVKIFRDRDEGERVISTLREMLRIDSQSLDTASELVAELEHMDHAEQAAEAARNLGAMYEARGILDLAEQEYRRSLRLIPDDSETWEKLIKVRTQLVPESELVRDQMDLAAAYLVQHRVPEALAVLSLAIQRAPRSVEARRVYIETYLQVGRDRDIAEDIISLADLLTESGMVEEAMAWYGRLLNLEPGNSQIREKLSQTQARRRGDTTAAMSEIALRHRAFSLQQGGLMDTDFDLSDTQARLVSAKPVGAKAILRPSDPIPPVADFLKQTLSGYEKDDEVSEIEQVINNYRDILAVNAQNANVRIKLADVLEQAGKPDDAMKELIQASEILFNKGELNLCISVCERVLAINPREQRVRDRLSKAINKRDAYKAIESAIFYSDRSSVEPENDTS